ncbi:hypothetical protein ACVWW4_006276 [Bradyrhizobium sp. LB7.1]
MRTIQPIGKKPVTMAQHRSADRHVGRHGEDEDRDQIGHDHGDDRRNMSLDAPARDQDQ